MRFVKPFAVLSLSIMLAFSLSACKSMQKKIVPVHDETLIYKLPFDLTYLRTIDALQHVPGWDLDLTEKEKGLIQVHNINSMSLSDADKRIVVFMIHRIGRNETSIQIAPEYQHVIGGDDLLQEIAYYLSREIKA